MNNPRTPQKTIVVTGGSKGLGLATVKLLLEHGYRVVALSRSEGALANLRDQFDDQLLWYSVDLASREAILAAFENIASATQSITGLVLNAAMAVPRDFERWSQEDIETSLSINVAGTLYCLQASLPLLRGGRAIFVSSESVENPAPMLSLYAGVKAAIETTIKGLRSELYQSHQIGLTVLRAGSMATAFSDNWSAQEKDTFFTVMQEKGYLEHTGSPMSPTSVAEGIKFLLEINREATINTLDIRSASAT